MTTVNHINDPFKYVCSEIIKNSLIEKYDYILIDEAQDLPNQFFQLTYALAKGATGEEKNIVWAYDDLQTIFNAYQRTAEELFGKNSAGQPNIDLKLFSERLGFGQENDLVLYKCYRNALEVLITAHALGFGVYSTQPVQMLENAAHWTDVGYDVKGQDLIKGKRVTITRPKENSPLTLSILQKPSQIIEYHEAEDLVEECKWVAKKTKEAINEGLYPHDIMIISLDDRNAKNYFTQISYLLAESNIKSNNILASASIAPDFHIDDMVTLTTIHRAKGNEGALVFAVGIDALYPYREMRNTRNKIFTAFTRSKAWLKVSGCNEVARYFFNEIDASLKNSPQLVFNFPDVKKIHTIQRDMESKSKSISQLQKVVYELKQQGFSDEDIAAMLESK